MTAEVLLGTPLPEEVMRPAGWREPHPYSDRARWASMLSDAETPWWAVAIADVSDIEGGERVRRAREQGRRLHGGLAWDIWAQVVQRAQQVVMRKTLDEWLDACHAEAVELGWSDSEHVPRETFERVVQGGPITRVVRDAALRSLRAFGQLCGLRDDEGRAIVFKDFHVQTVRTMRCATYGCVLLPWEHGKSFLNSIVVPLLDWAEFPDATEVRIYWNTSHSDKWIRRLMGVVERNERLHELFPWIARPVRGDAGWPQGGKPLWGTRGFSIRGRSIDDKAFEILTANQFSTGNRYSRVGGDDWVNTDNSKVVSIQERLDEYWHTGPETMPQQLFRQSAYGTAWPSVYYCGTLFETYDVGNSIFEYYGEKRRRGDERYRAVRFDCYVGNDSNKPIWPEWKSADYLRGKRDLLGERLFNMRCRNLIGGASKRVFPRISVRAAEWDGVDRPPMQWRHMPEGGFGGIIGFDPGSGKITKESKNPAYFVYCRRDARELLAPGLLRDPRLPSEAVRDPGRGPDIWHHGVEWGRLEGYSFTKQVEFLIALARYYNLPIAFESNNVQTAYGDLIRRDAPDVRTFSHQTGPGGADPTQGVEQFEPLFSNERIILHCAGAPMRSVIALRDELVNWKGRFTDIVMAMWIARHQSEQKFPSEQPQPQLRLATPPYLQRLQRGWTRFR